MIIKTTLEIFNDPWDIDKKPEVNPQRTPMRWINTTAITFDDIKLWEQIYFCPGAIGVYAAWEPYENFYAVFHLLHKDKKFVEIFDGSDAVNSLINKCQNFGVVLPIKNILVDN